MRTDDLLGGGVRDFAWAPTSVPEKRTSRYDALWFRLRPRCAMSLPRIEMPTPPARKPCTAASTSASASSPAFMVSTVRSGGKRKQRVGREHRRDGVEEQDFVASAASRARRR